MDPFFVVSDKAFRFLLVVFYHFDMEINVVADATTGDFILIDIDVIVELAATLLIERLVTFGSID